MKWRVHDPAEVQSINELNHKAMIWESMGKSQHNEKKEYVGECHHDNRLKRLPVLKGKSSMSVISVNRCYAWDDSCR